jgi:hypothetical protein
VVMPPVIQCGACLCPSRARLATGGIHCPLSSLKPLRSWHASFNDRYALGVCPHPKLDLDRFRPCKFNT